MKIFSITGWSGSVTQGHENDNPLSITMDSPKSITANFVRQYTLTIASGAGGTTEPEPGSYRYDTGTEVSIRAIPDAQYVFTGWSGNVPSYQTNSNPIQLLLDSDKSIQASFALKEQGTSEKKEGCFIATATYGSPMEPTVKLLREFRDRFLLRNSAGKILVNLYCSWSPPVAEFIASDVDDTALFLVRWSLLPLVGVSRVAVKLGPMPTLAVMLLFGTGLIGFAGFRRKF